MEEANRIRDLLVRYKFDDSGTDKYLEFITLAINEDNQ